MAAAAASVIQTPPLFKDKPPMLKRFTPKNGANVGEFKIKRKLGDGTSSTIYGAVHRQTKEKVALKFIGGTFYEQHSEMIVREVRSHRSFDHENVLKIRDAITDVGSSPIIVLERAKDTLHHVLVKKGVLQKPKAKLVIRQVLIALKYIHELGWIHRDVKLENVLIGQHGIVKLADFGFAIKTTESSKACLSGTPQYMPPECFVEPHTYGTGFDVWSVGILTFVLLTGHLPVEFLVCADMFAIQDEIILAKTNGGFDWAEVPELDDKALTFLNIVLDVNESTRPSASEVLELSWLSEAKKTRRFSLRKSHKLEKVKVEKS